MPRLRSHLICRNLNTEQACEHKFNHRCCYFENNCIIYLSCSVRSGPRCCTRALSELLSGYARASHCSGLPRAAQAPGGRASGAAAPGPDSCGSRPQSAGSVVVGHRLSCCETYGIFPDQRETPSPLHSQDS